MRERKHYLAIEIFSERELNSKSIGYILEIHVREMLGSTEAAKAGLQVLEISPASDKQGLFTVKGILSVDRKSTLKARAALALIKEIDGIKASCHVKGISGTIKRLREKFLS